MIGLKRNPSEITVETAPLTTAVAFERMLAVDPSPVLARRENIARSLEEVETAREGANRRLAEVRAQIREAGERPDPRNAAHALLSQAPMPPSLVALLSEEEQLLAGLKGLRQHEDAIHARRLSRNYETERAMADAADPLIRELSARTEDAFHALAAVYAAASALGRIVETGPLDRLARNLGDILIKVRSAGFTLPSEFEIPPEIRAFGNTPIAAALRRSTGSSIPYPRLSG